MTALHYAIEKRNVEMAKILLASGANANDKNIVSTMYNI